MFQPAEKAERIKKEAQNLYREVTKAYKLVEKYKREDKEATNELCNFMMQQSSSQYKGALRTGANNLQKVLQNINIGKMTTEEALKNLQTISISAITAEMIATEILSDGKQTALDEERF